jgi:hypothetical protein
MATCEHCDGSGQIDPMLRPDDPANEDCPHCNGNGSIPNTDSPLPRLEEDTLLVTPAQFSDMQVAAMKAWNAGASDYQATLAALRSAGLTELEIATRLMRETKVTVRYG